MNEFMPVFNLFCLIYGSFMTLYYLIKLAQRGSGNIFLVMLTLVALTWGLYSVAGVPS